MKRTGLKINAQKRGGYVRPYTQRYRDAMDSYWADIVIPTLELQSKNKKKKKRRNKLKTTT